MIELPQTRVALSTGIEVDVVDLGPRDAPVLIFLHGFPESHRTWRHQIAHLSDRFRCIAPDQRGYRESSKPADVAAYSPDRLTADVFALADALGVGRFTIVGHDWGGAIAWSVALTGQANGADADWATPSNGRPTDWAGRVERAIIANAPHPAIFSNLLQTDPVQRGASQYMRTFRDPASDAVVAEGGLGALLTTAIRWDSVPAMEPREREQLLADWSDRAAATAMLNWYRATAIDVPAMDAPYGDPVYDLEQFPRLRIPTLIIWAMDDIALPPCNLDGMDALVPNGTIVPVHGCGHFVPWEAPEQVNAAMDAFLDTAPR